MIPGLLAQDVAQSLREFIVTGFERKQVRLLVAVKFIALKSLFTIH